MQLNKADTYAKPERLQRSPSPPRNKFEKFERVRTPSPPTVRLAAAPRPRTPSPPKQAQVYIVYIYLYIYIYIYRYILAYRTQRNLFEILFNQPEVKLYLPFSDWFGTKLTSVWFRINRKLVNTIWFRFDLKRFRTL